MAPSIFLKFYVRLEGLKGQKMMKLNFSEKMSFWGKSLKCLQLGFLVSVENLIH